jgi:hypothetical protein
VDFCLILHFFFSWYRSVKKTGWKIDFWYLILFIGIVQHLLFLYPFNASPLNTLAMGPLQGQLEPYIDQAFKIGVVGYLSIWIGRLLCRPNFTFSFLMARVIENNVKSPIAFVFLYTITIGLGLILLSIQFSEGFFFNGRDFFLSSEFLRPLFNFTLSLFQIVIFFIALRKKWLSFLPILLISLCWGIRGIILGGLLQIWMQYAFRREGRVSLFKTSLFFSSLLLSAILIENLRAGSFNLTQACSSTLFSYFYGNNFSDTRDFACILSNWDGEFLYGKSYLAGLLSFIPRSFLWIREEWGITLLTNQWIGFDSNIMPGLRPGLFGEAFLNFSYFGVILLGLFFGFCLRYVDLKIKQHKDLIKGYSHSILFLFASSLTLTVGLWQFYIFIFINTCLIPLRAQYRLNSQNKKDKSTNDQMGNYNTHQSLLPKEHPSP